MYDQATPAIAVPAGLTTEGLLGRRYLARLIDSVIITVLVVLIGVGASVLLAPVLGNKPNILFLAVLSTIVWIGYDAVLESSPWQATLGKRLMRLRVYNQQAGRLTPFQSAARNLIKDGPFIALPAIERAAEGAGGIQSEGLGLFAYLLYLILLVVQLVVVHRSPVHQAIHDRLAKTWVAAPEESTQLHLT